MNGILLLIPIALGLGLLGLFAFFWAVGHGQFDDLEGAGHRILIDDDAPVPRPYTPQPHAGGDAQRP